MGHIQARVIGTPTDNLVSNLRGEVGEIIQSWVLWRQFKLMAASAQSDDLVKDMENEELAFVYALSDRLRDDIIARVAELAEKKIGQLTFHFASVKLGSLETDVVEFRDFTKAKRFREKRNYDISHKELPENWEDHKTIIIRYSDVTRGVARAA